MRSIMALLMAMLKTASVHCRELGCREWKDVHHRACLGDGTKAANRMFSRHMRTADDGNELNLNKHNKAHRVTLRVQSGSTNISIP